MTAVLVLAGLVGLAVGSFLNVVIWRVPRGESVVSPASACPACGHPIRARDNVPLLSWFVLRGRCRDCSAPISPRYWLVELASGAAVVGVVWRFWDTPWAIPVFGYLAVVGLALALIDVDVRRLPDALVLPSYPVVLVFLVLASAMTPDWGALGRAGIGAVALGAFYVLPWLVGGMGLGDVKLAPLLGAALAWLGWGAFAVGTFAAFLIGGAYGLSLLLARRAGRRSAVPFGPWMVLGAAVGVAAGEPVWAAYLGLLT